MEYNCQTAKLCKTLEMEGTIFLGVLKADKIPMEDVKRKVRHDNYRRIRSFRIRRQYWESYKGNEYVGCCIGEVYHRYSRLDY